VRDSLNKEIKYIPFSFPTGNSFYAKIAGHLPNFSCPPLDMLFKNCYMLLIYVQIISLAFTFWRKHDVMYYFLIKVHNKALETIINKDFIKHQKYATLVSTMLRTVGRAWAHVHWPMFASFATCYYRKWSWLVIYKVAICILMYTIRKLIIHYLCLFGVHVLRTFLFLNTCSILNIAHFMQHFSSWNLRLASSLDLAKDLRHRWHPA